MEEIKKIKIVLDGGHGYNTPGKRTPDDSMREWEFNNETALMARELLNQYQNIEVQLSHDVSGKSDVPLLNRTEYANKWGADLFLSIHANAFGSGGWNDADGIETFIHPTKPEVAVELAVKIQKNLIAMTGRDNRGVKTANFVVLDKTKMTSVLVECGFMTNKAEAELLKTKAYRVKCAKAIVEGIVQQYDLKLKPVPAPPKPAAVIQKAKGFTVQSGFFTNRDNAENLKKMLEAKGFDAFVKEVQ